MAHVLKWLRRDQELTQRALAKKARTTGAYIAMLEGGKKRNPSLDVMKRLARALGVPVAELLGRYSGQPTDVKAEEMRDGGEESV